MKIYIPSLEIEKNKNICNKLSDYLINTRNIEIFYTEKGIYNYENNAYVKYIPIDKDIEEYNINNYVFLIDKSEWKIIDKYYNIEPNYIYNSIKEKIFNYNNSTINCVIEIDNMSDNIIDIYFTLDDNKINLKTIKKEIHTFLSIMNFY